MKPIFMILVSLGVALSAGIAFLMIPSQENPMSFERAPEEKEVSALLADPSSSFPFFFFKHPSIPEKKRLSPEQVLLDPKYADKSPLNFEIPMDQEDQPKVDEPPKEEERPHFPTFRIVLDPKERTIISSELNSLVAKIYKRMGDAFEPGDLLISLDTRIVEGNYRKGKAKREKALIEWEGKKQLYDQDLISLFEVKDAESAFAEADSDFITAEKLLSASKIIASYKGKVVKLAIEELELAQLGKELIETIREDVLLGFFLAPAELLPCLKVGTELLIEVNGAQKKTTLTRLSPVIDPISGTIKVESEIDNKDRVWIPGLVGKVSVICQEKSTMKTSQDFKSPERFADQD